MEDIFGRALLDYQQGTYTEDIKTYSSLDETDSMPLPYLFRDHAHMPRLEQVALEKCFGKILDIGCGAGNHSLYLQNKGFDVTALDVSPGAIGTCRKRGIEKTANIEFRDFYGPKYDTLLLLMNGIGIVGKLGNLNAYLAHFKELLQRKGQVLLDSTDIVYMFQDEGKGEGMPPMELQQYYGEVEFIMEYKGERSKPFHWLYVDFDTLHHAALENGMTCELLCKGEHYDYLARLMVF